MRASDTTITDRMACEIAGISQTQARNWWAGGVLDFPPTARCDQRRVLQLVLAQELSVWVKRSRLKSAMRSARTQLAKLDLAAMHELSMLVWDDGAKAVTINHSLGELAVHTRPGRFVRLFVIGPSLITAREAFDNAVLEESAREELKGRLSVVSGRPQNGQSDAQDD